MGATRRRDEDRPLGPSVADRRPAWPRWPTRPATTARSARTASSCSAATRVLITNGGPTEPKDAAGRPDLARRRSRHKNPVANLFGKVAADRPRTGSAVPLADIWDFERRRQPGRERPATRRSIPTLTIARGRRAQARGQRRRRQRGQHGQNVFGRISNTSPCSRTVRMCRARSARDRMQAVPTSVEAAPTPYYVSQLTASRSRSAARIFRVNPRTGARRVQGRLHEHHGPGLR